MVVVARQCVLLPTFVCIPMSSLCPFVSSVSFVDLSWGIRWRYFTLEDKLLRTKVLQFCWELRNGTWIWSRWSVSLFWWKFIESAREGNPFSRKFSSRTICQIRHDSWARLIALYRYNFLYHYITQLINPFTPQPPLLWPVKWRQILATCWTSI